MSEVEWAPVVINVTYYNHKDILKVGETFRTETGEEAVITQHTDDSIEYKVGNNPSVVLPITGGIKFFKIENNG